MKASGWTIAIVILFAALTIANIMNYSARMRELNNITIRTNPIGGDPYQIGSQAARDRQIACLGFEIAIVVMCGAALLIAGGRARQG